MGQKSKLKEDMIPLARQLVASGSTRRYLAVKFGVSTTSVSLWEAKGKESIKRDIYKRFYEALAEGDAEYEQKLLTQVDAAATKGVKSTRTRTTKDAQGNIIDIQEEESASCQLRATTWQLEHRFKWSQHVVREKERLLNGIIRIAEKTVPPEQLEQLVNAIAQSKIGEELDMDAEFFN